MGWSLRSHLSSYGKKTPPHSNSVLSEVVDTDPSLPPSYNLVTSKCQIARFCSATASPLKMASSDVVTEQVLPIVVATVGAHGTVVSTGKSMTVAPPPPRLFESVI